MQLACKLKLLYLNINTYIYIGLNEKLGIVCILACLYTLMYLHLKKKGTVRTETKLMLIKRIYLMCHLLSFTLNFVLHMHLKMHYIWFFKKWDVIKHKRTARSARFTDKHEEITTSNNKHRQQMCAPTHCPPLFNTTDTSSVYKNHPKAEVQIRAMLQTTDASHYTINK